MATISPCSLSRYFVFQPGFLFRFPDDILELGSAFSVSLCHRLRLTWQLDWALSWVSLLPFIWFQIYIGLGFYFIIHPILLWIDSFVWFILNPPTHCDDVTLDLIYLGRSVLHHHNYELDLTVTPASAAVHSNYILPVVTFASTRTTL